MKRKLSLLLALVMILSLVPMSAFAASDNLVNRVYNVKGDYNFGDTGVERPYLRIENKNMTFSATGERFRLVLPAEAKWNDSAEVSGTTAPVVDMTTLATEPSFKVSTGSSVTYSAMKITDQILEIFVEGADVATDKFTIFVPMNVKLDGAAGDVKVTVQPFNSVVTGGTYTFAVASSGATITTFGSKEQITRSTSTGAAIVIDEAITGTFKNNDELRLRLPSEFTWEKGTSVELRNMTGTVEVRSGNVTVTGSSLATATLNNDGDRDLYVKLTGISANGRGSIVIKPQVQASRDAKYGDVTVSLTNVRGSFTATSGVIGTYSDYGITVEVEEVKEFVAGELNSDYRTAKIKIKESTEGSLISGRTIDFELPWWVKVTTEESIRVEAKTRTGLDINWNDSNVYGKASKFEIAASDVKATSGKSEVTITIPVTVSANMSGEFKLKVKGAGIEEQEVVVGKAIAPVTAEVKVQDVRLGIQRQDAPEIIIKENVPGALKKGNLDLKFANDIGFRFDAFDYEVVDGDIEIDDDASGRADENRTMQIVIKTESEKASTIKVKGIKMTVDRTAPEGKVQLDVRGTALVQNMTATPYTTDFYSRVARFDFANVITPAPGETKSTSKFVIGQNTYKVIENGVEVEKAMDVAPFINADGRTMMPVRYVAEALGVSADNIIWNAEAKTVTIMKGNLIAQMSIGSKTLLVNGVPVMMDTAAAIKDGRTVLPFRFAAQALGAQVEWDGDTRTVTIIQ